MKFSLLLITTGLWTIQATAQIAQGGEPYQWKERTVRTNDLAHTELAALPPGSQVDTDANGLVQYGVQRFIAADVLAEGTWDDLPGGQRRCRMLVSSADAVMLSLQFDVFDLSPEVWMYIYNTERTHYLGGFTEANELHDGGLSTAVLPGDAVVIEVIMPATARASRLHLASLTHGYRDIFHFNSNDGRPVDDRDYDPGYQSAPCHNNVNCAVAAEWQEVKRATAMFLRPDGSGCTGTLLNNTQQNGTPYFLIANHCYQPTTSQWVFYFNYESATCSGSSGPTNQTITGATFKAGDYYADFDLIQLSSAPPEAYEPYYAGWDRSGSPPSSGTAIEHPLFDVKKIAFDYDPLTSYTSGSTQMWRTYWNSGIIESIASGSGLYDQNQRLVGHIVDGPQTCANATTAPSFAVKFSTIWNGPSSTERVRDWLDPSNGTTVLNGYDPYSGSPSVLNLHLNVTLEGPYNTDTGLMNDDLRTNGYVPQTEPYTGLGYAHMAGGGGEIAQDGVLSATGETAVVDWVVIELRNKNNDAQRMATRSALLLRNGRVVDMNGTNDLQFNMPADQYYIAVRHRNHLSVMTQNAIALSGSTTVLDLTNGSVALYGGPIALKNVNGMRCMYAGDVNSDGRLKYTGSANDRDPILVALGGNSATATISGYFREDVNLSGDASYTGPGNDRDPILVNIGGDDPSVVVQQHLP